MKPLGLFLRAAVLFGIGLACWSRAVAPDAVPWTIAGAYPLARGVVLFSRYYQEIIR